MRVGEYIVKVSGAKLGDHTHIVERIAEVFDEQVAEALSEHKRVLDECKTALEYFQQGGIRKNAADGALRLIAELKTNEKLG